eukprot:g35708.t1
MGRCYTFDSCRGRCRGSGVKEEWTRVPWRERSVWKTDKEGGEYVSGGGILLEVAELASYDPLDVDAGGMVAKNKGNPIAGAGGNRKGEGGSLGDGSNPVEGPVNNGDEESLVEDGGEHLGGSLVKGGLIGTFATETKELEEWNGVFTGNRVRGCP